MGEAACFQQLFSNLISHFKDNNMVKEVSSHFGPQKSLDDMFSYLWGLQEAHQYLTPKILKTGKSDADSERYRTEGNRFYQKKILDRALKLYNLSIMSAPHPSLTVNATSATINDNDIEDINKNKACSASAQCKEGDYRSLALGYANRSAILLELQQFDKCMKDIDLALMYGYPKLLQSKLAERKAKCLINQRKLAEAKVVLESSMQALDDLSLDEAKSKSTRDSLCKLIKQCQIEEKTSAPQAEPSSLQRDLSAATPEELLFTFEDPKPPELLKPNPTIPCLSAAIRLTSSPSKGRYLVAERDIKPGEVLVVEEGYSQILHLDSSLRTHCSTCFARCLTLLPCPTCSKVIFCSETCRTGVSSHHANECKIIPSLAALDMGKNSVLALRILMQTTLKQLRDLIPKLRQEAKHLPPESLGFNDHGIYSSSEYRPIYHLVTNKESRSVSDLFKRCAMSLILTKLLQESKKYFVNDNGDPYEPTQEDISLAGCALFVHMMNLPCNAHSITELQVDVSSYQKSASQEIGAGAFAVLSLTNHSCNPAAARFSYGSAETLRAIRFISKGMEITDSYGEHYGVKGPEARRAALSQQYYFNCICDACEKKYPTYLSLPMNLLLRCPKCFNTVRNDMYECTHCKNQYADLKDNQRKVESPSFNLENVLKDIKDAEALYHKAYASILDGNNIADNRTAISNIIELIDRYVQMPCRTYFEAQETLKHCFDRLGSCVYRKECGEINMFDGLMK